MSSFLRALSAISLRMRYKCRSRIFKLTRNYRAATLISEVCKIDRSCSPYSSTYVHLVYLVHLCPSTQLVIKWEKMQRITSCLCFSTASTILITIFCIVIHLSQSTTTGSLQTTNRQVTITSSNAFRTTVSSLDIHPMASRGVRPRRTIETGSSERRASEDYSHIRRPIYEMSIDFLLNPATPSQSSPTSTAPSLSVELQHSPITERSKSRCESTLANPHLHKECLSNEASSLLARR